MSVETRYGLPTVLQQMTMYGSEATIEVDGIVVHRCLPTDEDKPAFPASKWKLD